MPTDPDFGQTIYFLGMDAVSVIAVGVSGMLGELCGGGALMPAAYGKSNLAYLQFRGHEQLRREACLC